MKKVLFATTALVMTAGVAAAEVAVSGNGRMGIAYNGTDWNFSSRARVQFTLSGQTDGGLAFGGSFRADQAGDGAADAWGADKGTAGSVYISGAFGKIEMGDVVSAPEALFGDLYEVGYTDIGNNDIPYLTLDNAGATTETSMLYTYSAGAFSVAASMSDETTVDTVYAVAGAYTAGDYTFGLGYEDNGAVSQVELAGVAKVGAANVKAYYADVQDSTVVDSAYGLSVDGSFGATTVGAFYQVVNNIAVADVAYYGVGASYDLGGGASIKGGIADNDIPGSDAVADLGIKFSF